MRVVSVPVRRLLFVLVAGVLASCELTSVPEEEIDIPATSISFEAFVRAPASAAVPIDTLAGQASLGYHAYVVGWTDPTGGSHTDTLRAPRFTLVRSSGSSIEELVQLTVPDEQVRVGVYSASFFEPGSPPRRFQAFYTPDGTCRYTRLSGAMEILAVTEERIAGQFDLQMAALASVVDGQASTTCPDLPQQIRVTGWFDAEVRP